MIQSTYCWPSGQQWHVMSHSSWMGRSHWLWLQTMQLVHKRRNQKQHPSWVSTPECTNERDVHEDDKVWHSVCCIKESVTHFCPVGCQNDYLWAVRSNCDSEQVHGHKHSSHHADQDEMTRIAIDSLALLYKMRKDKLVLLAISRTLLVSIVAKVHWVTKQRPKSRIYCHF